MEATIGRVLATPHILNILFLTKITLIIFLPLAPVGMASMM
jgi:hypothetical protein